MKPQVYAVLLAAGNGNRFGKQKQFLRINGKYLFEYSLNTILKIKSITSVTLTLPKNTDAKVLEFCKRKYPKVRIAFGGKNRLFSIKSSIEKFTPDNSRTILFDASRPLTTKKMITDLISTSLTLDTNVLIGKKISDAIVEVIDNKSKIIIAKNRDNYLITYTPFIFITKNLIHSINNSNLNKEIDIATLVNLNKYKITYNTILHHDLKITYPEDLKLFKSYLRKTSLNK